MLSFRRFQIPVVEPFLKLTGLSDLHRRQALFRGDEALVHRLLADSSSRWKLRAWDKDGEPRPVEIAFGAVHGPDGELTHWVVTFVDRAETERLRAELDEVKSLAAVP